MKNKIFIAIDTNKVSKAKKIIRDTQTKKIKIGYKFGLEFMNSKNGRRFISTLRNKIIFIDTIIVMKKSYVVRIRFEC